MQSSDCERAMSIQPTAMATSPHPGVGLYPMGVLSPLARMDTASLLGRESSVVWVHSQVLAALGTERSQGVVSGSPARC